MVMLYVISKFPKCYEMYFYLIFFTRKVILKL